MVRTPSFDSNGIKRGAWSAEEDNILRDYVQRHGNSNWRLLPSLAGLARCGKSCRLRWVNYLKPGVRRGKFSKEEEDLIIKLHAQFGNKWSAIAANLPGRTDNDIKNYWHAHIMKRSKHNWAVTRAISAPTPQGPASNNVLIQGLSGKSPDNINAINPIADTYVVPKTQGDLRINEPCDKTCFSQLDIDLPPFAIEEFNGLGFCQNDMSAFSDFSDGGIASWNSSTDESPSGNCWTEPLEDDIFDMVLW